MPAVHGEGTLRGLLSAHLEPSERSQPDIEHGVRIEDGALLACLVVERLALEAGSIDRTIQLIPAHRHQVRLRTAKLSKELGPVFRRWRELGGWLLPEVPV